MAIDDGEFLFSTQIKILTPVLGLTLSPGVVLAAARVRLLQLLIAATTADLRRFAGSLGGAGTMVRHFFDAN